MHLKTLLFTAAVLLLAPLSIHAQDRPEDCPSGYQCISENKAQSIQTILERHKCLRTAFNERGENFSLTFEPWSLVVTRDHQVFAKEDLKGTLRLCSWRLDLRIDPNISASLAEEEERPGIDWGLEPRIKIGFLLHPIDMFSERAVYKWGEPALLFEPFHLGFAHLEVHTGLESFGLGVGADLTRNMDIYAAPRIPWMSLTDQPRILPTVGVSVSIN